MTKQLNGWFPILVSVLLGAMLVIEVSSVRGESQTWDEAIYLAAGYSYWHGSDHRLNREHPLLGKLLVSLPLLPFDLSLPKSDASWTQKDETRFGRLFLYHNRIPADQILFLGRSVTIVLSLLLGLLLALWTRARASPWAGIIALTIYAFDPTVLAHGRYATNDLAVAFFAFAAVCMWDWALRDSSVARYAGAGAVLALAIATKISALFLVPVFVILALLAPRRAALDWGVPVAIASALVALFICSLGDLGIYGDSFAAATIHTSGALSYLFGMESTHGWWWYFPAAFAVKAPVGLLILSLLTIVLLGMRFRDCRDLLVVAVPCLVYGVLCLFDRADIGIRYLLPMYPFAFATIGIVTARYAPRVVVLVGLAMIVVESLSVYPNELAFFNVLVGGPGAGPRYLIDSNIDWGQDLEKLQRWLAARDVRHPCISYFGTAPLEYYGLEAGHIPPYWDLAGRRNIRCMTAVSVTYLYGGTFVGRDAARWLRAIEPTAKIGYSIYVYDLRHGDPIAFPTPVVGKRSARQKSAL